MGDLKVEKVWIFKNFPTSLLYNKHCLKKSWRSDNSKYKIFYPLLSHCFGPEFLQRGPPPLYKNSTAVINLTAVTKWLPFGILDFPITFYRDIIWQFLKLILLGIICENFIALWQFTKIQQLLQIKQLQPVVTFWHPWIFPLHFTEKWFKTIFEAYDVRNHVWKFHCPVTIYKNSTAVTILTAATSRWLLASLNFPMTFNKEMFNNFKGLYC